MRYSVLGAGLFVGFSTDLKLNRAYAAHKKEEEHHDALLSAATEMWDQYLAKQVGVSFNPDDKDFDLEKVMDYVTAMQ